MQTYSQGSGAGQAGWAPVMGNSYYKNMTGWNDGPTPYGCANTQDNLTIITYQNGFSYRTDDFAESRNTGTHSLGSNSFNVNGIITTSADQDAFKYTASQTVNFHLDATPYNVGPNNAGANLDMKISLFNGSNLVATYDPAESMSITIDTILNAGTYYFVVDGTGNSNAGNYGSLGSFTLTGFNGPLPIHEIILEGNTDKEKHALKWNIVADEPIKSIELEVSNDGTVFRPLTTLYATAKKFSYTAYNSNTLYYRLKVTSVIDQTAFSNTVALKTTARSETSFAVTTFVTNEITVNASEDYSYRLSDINGRMISAGNGIKGINKINTYNKPAGLYVIQLFTNSMRQTERIIKQ